MLFTETRKETIEAVKRLKSECIASFAECDALLSDESSLKAFAACLNLVNLYLNDMEEEAELLTNIEHKLDDVLCQLKEMREGSQQGLFLFHLRKICTSYYGKNFKEVKNYVERLLDYGV